MPRSPVRPTHPNDVALRKARLEANRRIELEQRAITEQQAATAPTAPPSNYDLIVEARARAAKQLAAPQAYAPVTATSAATQTHAAPAPAAPCVGQPGFSFESNRAPGHYAYMAKGNDRGALVHVGSKRTGLAPSDPTPEVTSRVSRRSLHHVGLSNMMSDVRPTRSDPDAARPAASWQGD
jgi:hypothetical protein